MRFFTKKTEQQVFTCEFEKKIGKNRKKNHIRLIFNTERCNFGSENCFRQKKERSPRFLKNFKDIVVSLKFKNNFIHSK